MGNNPENTKNRAEIKRLKRGLDWTHNDEKLLPDRFWTGPHGGKLKAKHGGDQQTKT